MIQFDTIEIRYYTPVLSNNPACLLGPAIELSWDYWQTTKMKLNTYELLARNKKRRQRSIYLSAKRRHIMLS